MTGRLLLCAFRTHQSSRRRTGALTAFGLKVLRTMKSSRHASFTAAPVAIALLGAVLHGGGISGLDEPQNASLAPAAPGAPAQASAPFVPQPILPGGQIVTLFPSDSPYLHKDRISEPE